MNQLDRFVVEEELLVVTEEGVGRPRGERPRRRFARRRAHAPEDVLVREDVGRVQPESRVAWSVSAERPAGRRDQLIGAGVIVVHVRVDDEADRLVRDRADGGEHVGATPSSAGIDDEDAFLAGLYDDVSAGADDHVHLALDVHGLERVR